MSAIILLSYIFVGVNYATKLKKTLHIVNYNFCLRLKCAQFDGKCTKALWIDYAVFHILLSQNMLFHGIRFQVLNVMAPYSSARKFTTSDYRRNICVEFFCTRNTRSRQTYWVCRVEEYAHNKRPQQRVWRRRLQCQESEKCLWKPSMSDINASKANCS